MSYLGNDPAEAYSPTVKDTFSGNDSTTDFTLSIPATTNSVNVYVENVAQEPTTAYTISGTTLSFTAAPVTGTNNIYVIHRGPAVQTVVPPAGVALNPSDVTATGNLSVAGTSTLTGNVSASGNLAVTGTTTLTDDLAVDTDTLYVDVSEDRVGINTSAPKSVLDLGTGSDGVTATPSGSYSDYAVALYGSTTSTQIRNFIGVGEGSAVAAGIGFVDNGTGGKQGITLSAGDLTTISEVMRVDGNGYVLMG